MLYGARECARLLVEEGLDAAVARHELHGRAMLAGVRGLGLGVFGDVAHKMHNVVAVEIPDGVDGDAARAALLDDFGIEIGTSFGPLHGKVWRIGTMGYNARTDAVLTTLAALEQVLAHRAAVASTPPGGVRRMTTAREVLDRCAELDRFTATPPQLERVYLSPRARQRQRRRRGRWMEQAGLRTWQDAAGNVCGRREGREPGLPALLLGSHLDTVPDAGSFDGMLGVVMAIAVAERLGDPDRGPPVRARGDRLQRRGGHPLRHRAARQPGRRRRVGGGLVGPPRPRRRHAAPGVPGPSASTRAGSATPPGDPTSWSATSRRTSSRARYLEVDGPLARLRHHDRRRPPLPALGHRRGPARRRHAVPPPPRRPGRRQRGDRRDRAAAPAPRSASPPSAGSRCSPARST